jgi:hypothetical protein
MINRYRRVLTAAVCLALALLACAWGLGNREANRVNNDRELVAAAMSGDTASARRLLGAGASPEARNDFSAGARMSSLRGLLRWGRRHVRRRTPRGRTVTELAIERGHDDIYRLLMARGIPVNEKNAFGQTLLWVAANAGRTEIVKDLIARGADPRIRDQDGLTPVDAANNAGQWDIAKLIQGVLRRTQAASPQTR